MAVVPGGSQRGGRPFQRPPRVFTRASRSRRELLVNPAVGLAAPGEQLGVREPERDLSLSRALVLVRGVYEVPPGLDGEVAANRPGSGLESPRRADRLADGANGVRPFEDHRQDRARGDVLQEPRVEALAL